MILSKYFSVYHRYLVSRRDFLKSTAEKPEENPAEKISEKRMPAATAIFQNVMGRI